MACDKRQATGSCPHHQCEYSYDTDHGYECVDIFGGFCECGLDCVKECPYSYTKKDEPEVNAVVESIFSEAW